jgi:NADPH:quinone reductase-like Zn-dependent oxidoreductase
VYVTAVRLNGSKTANQLDGRRGGVRSENESSCLQFLKGDVPSCGPGRILGYEGVGVVQEVGVAVTGFVEGDRVLISCISSMEFKARAFSQKRIEIFLGKMRREELTSL